MTAHCTAEPVICGTVNDAVDQRSDGVIVARIYLVHCWWIVLSDGVRVVRTLLVHCWWIVLYQLAAVDVRGERSLQSD